MRVQRAVFCPTHGTIDVVTKKWSLLVVNELGNHGNMRYSTLMIELQGISSSTLSAILKDLEKLSVVQKKTYAEIPPRTEYYLTYQGVELRRATSKLLQWIANKDHKIQPTCSLFRKQ